MKSSWIYVLLLALIVSIGCEAGDVTIGKGQKKDVTGSAKQVGVAIDAGNYSDYASPAEFKMFVGTTYVDVKISQQPLFNRLKICFPALDSCINSSGTPGVIVEDGVFLLKNNLFSSNASLSVRDVGNSSGIKFYPNGNKQTIVIGLSEDAPSNFKLIAKDAEELSLPFSLKQDILLKSWFPYVNGGIFAIMIVLGMSSSSSCFCCGHKRGSKSAAPVSPAEPPAKSELATTPINNDVSAMA